MELLLQSNHNKKEVIFILQVCHYLVRKKKATSKYKNYYILLNYLIKINYNKILIYAASL